MDRGHSSGQSFRCPAAWDAMPRDRAIWRVCPLLAAIPREAPAACAGAPAPRRTEPARRIFASLSELGELLQIKELKRHSAISRRSGERRHALNPEHVLQEASASHESGTSNGSALVTVLVEQSDESGLGEGQRWYLLVREQSRISVSQLPRTRVRDLAQDAFLLEMQGMRSCCSPDRSASTCEVRSKPTRLIRSSLRWPARNSSPIRCHGDERYGQT